MIGSPSTSNLPSFESLFELEEIQEIQDSFAAATRVASIITDVKGSPITRPSNFCRLCREIIRKTEKGLFNCMQSDRIIGRYHQQGPVIQPCLSSGLWDAGVSIHVGGNHIANWLIGQVRTSDMDMEQMTQYARTIGADPDQFSEALAEVTEMSLDQFKNIAKSLFPIIGFSEMILEDLPRESPLRESMRTVLSGAFRARDLVQQILMFSRETEQEVHPLKIQLILKEVLKLAKATLPSTIKIISHIPDRIGRVMADPTQIHQVAMNLITNALHVMEETGGELRVDLSEMEVEKKE